MRFNYGGVRYRLVQGLGTNRTKDFVRSKIFILCRHKNWVSILAHGQIIFAPLAKTSIIKSRNLYKKYIE